MKRLYAAFLLAATLSAADQPFRISGVVVDAVTNRTMARTRVLLASSNERDAQRSIVAAADGTFRFDSLAAGKYTLSADHPSGVRQNYGQPEMAPAGFGIAVVVGPDLKTEGLVFRLFPPGAIHGRITDQQGEAVEGVLVQLFRVMVARGKRTGYYHGSSRTDDIGEYRFGPLPAGTYYLLATGRPWYTDRLKNTQADSPLARTGYVPIFFPNSRDARGATSLRVRAGQDIPADFIVTALPAGNLTVVAKPPGEPAEDVSSEARVRRIPGDAARFEITFEGPAGSIAWERVDWIYGTGTYPGIPQGRYTIRISTTDAAKPLYGRADVVVSGGATRVEIPLTPPTSVTGVLRMQGSDHAIPRGTLIEMENESEARHIRRPVEADGSFVFENLPPGQYMPLLMSPVQALRVAQVTIDGQMAKELMLDINRPVGVEVTGITKAGEVSGYLYRNGEAQAGVEVILVPKREKITPYDIIGFETDSDGSFEFNTVTPGDYLLVPVEDFAEVEYANPEVLRQYLKGAIEIRVEADSKSKPVRIEMR
jgi:hypothetical protein